MPPTESPATAKMKFIYVNEEKCIFHGSKCILVRYRDVLPQSNFRIVRMSVLYYEKRYLIAESCIFYFNRNNAYFSDSSKSQFYKYNLI